MNRYNWINSLTAPVMVVLTGVLALLSQAHILSWAKSWPFYLITLGILRLAQRAALSQMAAEAYPVYPGVNPPTPGAPPSSPTTTSIVPTSDSRSDATEWRP